MRRPSVLARARMHVVIVLAAAMVASGHGVVAANEPVREPATIAAIGDSITRGTNAFGWYGDHPSLSWSTGLNPLDGWNSHYERLIRNDVWDWPDELNVSEAGATMAEAAAQAERVVQHDADYVTFLLGANDLCAPSTEAMTSLGEFRAGFEAAMATLADGVPDARVFVASIPDLLRLWRLYKDDPIATAVWRTGGICLAMLGAASSANDRFHVFVRELAFNYVLADVCARYAGCVFDANAVFRHAFDADEVSKLDFFHPSTDGQNALASMTWDRAWSNRSSGPG